jgi:phosphoribosylformylglycinamidine synthase
MTIIHYYRTTPTPHSLLPSLSERLAQSGSSLSVLSVRTEACFNIQLTAPLCATSTARLEWLLSETFDKSGLRLEHSSLAAADANTVVLEFGPRNSYASAFSSNAVGICSAIRLPVCRLEKSRRYLFVLSAPPSEDDVERLSALLHDRMTEERYVHPVTSFETGTEPERVERVPIMEEGRGALEKINREKGLGFDEFDLDFYTTLFKASRCRLQLYTCICVSLFVCA